MFTKAMLLSLAALAAGSPSAALGAHRGTHSRAHIIARPSSAMIYQTISLTGTGFARSSRVTLSECAGVDWIAPQDPCVSGNETTVQTNGAGRFQTTFKVALCEGITVPPTQRVCHIGEVLPSGIDTLELVGAAKVIVSYP